ncbi:hypothetical protein [Sphingobium nicotianae]|uniref:DUF1515 domain-containing protein n=1 Tax=Sphingobium nicotianae TaxID=2782607 RepID=A0A9X1IPI1_9SPHN|nr:hypothetical protein [Sphingobium nicotianae]MBT2186178.1 hypothetical protein [Sphingobium nicotianae]
MSTRPDHGLESVRESLDRLLGKVEAMTTALDDQNEKLVRLAERTATLEQLGQETKQVVEAWTAAKGSLRFMKWLAGLIAAVAGTIAAIKGWPHK